MEAELPRQLNPAWYLRVPRSSLPFASDFRLSAEVSLLVDDETCWLAGPVSEPALLGSLRALPGARLHFPGAPGLLREEHRVLATVPVPRGSWIPLSEWMLAAAPASVPTRGALQPVPLQLVADGHARGARAMIVGVDEWARYAESAPEARLSCLESCTSPEGRILLHGDPLPPIPGEFLAETGGILHPLGTRWAPGIEPEDVRMLVGANPDDLVLIRQDSIDLIAPDMRLRVTRAAVRQLRRPAR